jgi:hypothetical protein
MASRFLCNGSEQAQEKQEPVHLDRPVKREIPLRLAISNFPKQGEYSTCGSGITVNHQIQQQTLIATFSLLKKAYTHPQIRIAATTPVGATPTWTTIIASPTLSPRLRALTSKSSLLTDFSTYLANYHVCRLALACRASGLASRCKPMGGLKQERKESIAYV